jgi:hypothetical protein
MADTFSSPTVNVETWIRTQLWSSFQAWERSASSAESITNLRAFISTLSLISDGSFEVERRIYSMWTIATQTSNLLEEHQRKVTTMRSRMETLWAGGLRDQYRAEVEMARLLTSGLELRVRRIEMSFGHFATSWIQKLLPVLSVNSRSTPIGGSHRPSQSMSHPEELNLLARMLTEEMSGYVSLASDWENHQ